ncbi:MAG: hypothetical protein WD512_16660 [Candidatus Paceibacterota bacterium]
MKVSPAKSQISDDPILSSGLSGESVNLRRYPYYHHLTAAQLFQETLVLLKRDFGIKADPGEAGHLRKLLVTELQKTISDHTELHLRRVSKTAITNPMREAAFKLVQEFYVHDLTYGSFYSAKGEQIKYSDVIYNQFVDLETDSKIEEFREHLSMIRFRAKNPFVK